jgi:two-component system CheB/CheR fusion protein
MPTRGVESVNGRVLCSSLEDLADLFDSAPVGIHWAGPDGTILRANQAELDLLGYRREEYVGRNVAEFHADREAYEALLQRLRGGERLRGHDARLLCEDGSVRHVLLDAYARREGDRFVHVCCFTRDVTERKRAEEARSLLAAIIESSDDAIVSKTLDGVVTSWNAGAERLFGYAAAEAVGRPITLIIPHDLRDEEQMILERLRRGERIEHYDTVRRAKDGRLIDISLTISPVRDSTGQVVGASKVARDVSVRKRAEEALREADRRKDEFLAMLAHELRNPLAPISNAVRVLRAKGPPLPELQWARDVIDRQVQQMTRLVDDLLDVSRITRGKIMLRRERVELAAVVSSAVEASRPLVEKWGHELTVKLPPEPVHLEADPTRLAQVLSNLLNNAAKYTDQGGRIALTAAREGDALLIRVRDSGVGIPREMLPHVFEMFTQVDGSLERSQGGLGIGLTLVRSLVQMHGGTVTAHSDGPGKGSEFVVRLPLAGAARDRGPQAANGSPAAAPPRSRILVVDDNRDAADSLAMLLRLSGHEVHVAHDGLEAMGTAAVFRPDVVLLDIGLPKLNGYEAGRRIRRERGDGVVLIALTGWGQEEDRARSKEAGFDHHLTKPVNLDALQQLLAKCTPTEPERRT